ncbi:hypothetical protein C8034_v003939 [Colletotrichum sidae]|uniref:Uncharacterized protein n=1 Tax=Colletotrichum sidae TaxID=1347389 RepID=A0A4R8TP17_9PEZI|nr:hypothetical protein C8034_v003939 [Colletotrichum sidae]
MLPTGALVLSLAALAAAAPSNDPRAVDNSGPFQIYAYGTGIGGLSLFSSGGDAYFGDHTTFNDSQAAPVIFTPSTDNVWTGAPNTTGFDANSTLPAWSNLTFSVPSTGSGDHAVGFTNSTAASGRQTSGFILYGTFIFVESTAAGGGMESLWYATPSSVDGVYSLKWNQTGDASADQITLTLKKTPPSNSGSETRDSL